MFDTGYAWGIRTSSRKYIYPLSGRLCSVTGEYTKNPEIHPCFSAIPLHQELFRNAQQQTFMANDYLLTMQIISIDYLYTYTYPLGNL